MKTAENRSDIVTEIQFNAAAGTELSAIIDLICSFTGEQFDADNQEQSVNILARLLQYSGIMGATLGVTRPEYVGQASHVFDMSTDFLAKLEDWIEANAKVD